MPEWIKSDAKISRQITAYGKLLDVMSPNSRANLGADKHAFAALMRHIREMDSTQHTVIMMQVGDESGGIGTVRDYSAAAQKLSAANVPESLTLRRIASRHLGAGLRCRRRRTVRRILHCQLYQRGREGGVAERLVGPGAHDRQTERIDGQFVALYVLSKDIGDACGPSLAPEFE